MHQEIKKIITVVIIDFCWKAGSVYHKQKSQRNSSHWKYFCRNLKKIHSCYQVKIDSVTLEFKTKYICNTSMDIVKYKYKVVIIDDDGYTNLPCL